VAVAVSNLVDPVFVENVVSRKDFKNYFNSSRRTRHHPRAGFSQTVVFERLAGGVLFLPPDLFQPCVIWPYFAP